VRSEILEKHPEAKTQVEAVWFRNLWTDARFLWPSSALDGPRVMNFWDADKIAGKWYAANLTQRRKGVEWDTWILYAPGKTFSDPPLAWGHTIVGSRERLRNALEELQKASAAPRTR
jgi:hypothetical protein